MKKALVGIAAAAWAVAAGSAFAGQLAIPSPDGHAVIRIEDDASRFSVRWRGQTVVAASPLGLELDGAPAFGALALERREDTEVDREIPLVATKASVARDHYRGATLTFRETDIGDTGARRLVIDVRAYDDGVALRSGTVWYVGAMTANEARTAQVSLSFLPAGRYRATVWEDGEAPDEVRRSERTVTARDTLALRLSPAGGAAVTLEPR